MPDKPLTVLTYAASASLAAVALIYFFNPNYIIDGEGNTSQLSRRARLNSVVGLHNPANDCFINSVLQALAGLGELRIYLIREVHRRTLDRHQEIYHGTDTKDEDGRPIDRRKVQSLLDAEVTCGLKEMLDRLNERPLQKKVISATTFVAALESAFATRVNRNQQDAQELLQVVAERLSDEYAAGRAARKRAHEKGSTNATKELADATQREEEREQKVIQNQHERADAVPGGSLQHECKSPDTAAVPTTLINGNALVTNDLVGDVTEEDGFPLEGQTQSQIECQHCRFIPKSTPSSFIMLTLSVPHKKSSSSLNECFDGAFKTEYIDDYRCDRCRLQHAVSAFERDLAKARTEDRKQELKSHIQRLQKAIEEDPESPPEDIQLPDSKHAPTRRIARSVAITSFPKILVVHLSRSAFDPSSFTSKNNAKVVFPERLPLGSLMDRRNYRLLGVVTHKGTHYSGHYETLRRQHIYPPSSNPHLDQGKGPYSSQTRKSRNATKGDDPSKPRVATPGAEHTSESDSEQTDGNGGSTVRDSSTSTAKPRRAEAVAEAMSPTTTDSNAESASSPTRTSMSTLPTPSSVLRPDSAARSETPSSLEVPGKTQSSEKPRSASRQQVRDKIEEAKEQKKIERRKKQALKESQRWWRISDDKIKECKTSDVLNAQKEVYMLFYEMEK